MGRKPGAMPKLAKSAVLSLDKFVDKRASAQDLEFIQKVTAYLHDHPDEAKRVWWALESGAFSKESAQQTNEIPATRTHINLLSAKFLKGVLKQLAPTFNDCTLKTVEKHDINNIMKLFCFATSCKPMDPVWTRDGNTFTEYYVQVHAALGNRLQRVRVAENGEVCWENGMYKVVADTERQGKFKLQHISGTAVPALSW